MAKIVLSDITSGLNQSTIVNSNFQSVEDALNTLVLYRDNPAGETNTMSGNLDMNSQRITNLVTPTTPQEPATKAYVDSLSTISTATYITTTVEETTATAGQTVFNLSNAYTPGANNLNVYISGVYQAPSAYSETSTTSITFSGGLVLGDIVVFVVNPRGVSTDALNAADVRAAVASASDSNVFTDAYKLASDNSVTLTSTSILSNKTLTLPQINDTSSDHQYVFAVSELAADRTVTLPLLGADDEFVFKDQNQTLTNKLLTSPVFVTSADLNGATLILDADGDTSIRSDTDDYIIVKISGADDFRFMAGSFQALAGSEITTNALTETTSSAGITVSANLKMASGNGIDFSATSDASGMASELFDDYEEGTWTPILTDGGLADLGATYAANGQRGSYTKIGNRVYISAYILMAGFGTLTTSQSANIIGLPYAAATYTGTWQWPFVTVIDSTSFAAPHTYASQINDGDSTILLRVSDLAGGYGALTVAELTTSGIIRINGTYETA